MYGEQSGNLPSMVNEIDNAVEPGSSKDMVRLFINIGSSSKIQPKHIIESLVASTGLPGKLVGAIDIFDRYSFVEVPKDFAPEVLKSMKNYTIKGKRINIEKSNARKKSGRSTSFNRLVSPNRRSPKKSK